MSRKAGTSRPATSCSRFPLPKSWPMARTSTRRNSPRCGIRRALQPRDAGADFFCAVPAIRDKLVTLTRVGLGYIKIGQPATTLSGGEAQRVKPAKELSRRATGRTLYILDEPTTGLHFEDVRKLLEVLHALVPAGNKCRYKRCPRAQMPLLDTSLGREAHIHCS